MQQHLTITITVDELREIIREELKAVLDKIDKKIEDPATDLLDMADAAKLLKRSKATIYGLVNNRIIPHAKKGNRLYFSKSELIDWMKSGRRRTKEEIYKSL